MRDTPSSPRVALYREPVHFMSAELCVMNTNCVCVESSASTSPKRLD